MLQILRDNGKTIIEGSVVCSAQYAKHRNKQIKFEDAVE